MCVVACHELATSAISLLKYQLDLQKYLGKKGKYPEAALTLVLHPLLFQSLKTIVYFIDSNKPATIPVNLEYEATAVPPDDHSKLLQSIHSHPKDMVAPEYEPTAAPPDDHSQRHICIHTHSKDMVAPVHETTAVPYIYMSYICHCGTHTIVQWHLHLTMSPLYERD